MVMTNEERDSYIRATHDTVVRLAPTVEDLKKTVYGNGTPGLKQQLAILSEREENCPAKAAYEERWVDANHKREDKKVTISVVVMVVAIVSAGVTAVSTIVNIILK